MANPTYLADDAAVTAREAEVPAANFENGANMAASNACGVGINMAGGAVVGTDEQFTLLDQAEADRTPQNSQILGTEAGDEVAIRSGVNATQAEKEADSAEDGTVTDEGEATLTDLATGWTPVVP